MVTVRKLFQRFVPGFIKRFIDPVTANIDKFVESSFSDVEPGHLILDAGAGECRFKDKLKGKLHDRPPATSGPRRTLVDP